ncbi:type II toxin-antitoxin system VapB family antitoxin [Spirosoma panaciterrae]|uniref:type II toxin-antitoxin system VapB family antitoxin n=1 Tax=Spirosoma panaciterrae TaxID=496058 RepID=UPI0003650C09|nr:DUF2281 domain-containing protein [Spirosoma panaciterrae]
MTYLQLYQKYQRLSPVYQQEVDDFVEFLTARKKDQEQQPLRKTPVFGSAKGQFHMRPDFDTQLDEFADYQ